jgi:hypothetical protein
MKYDNKDGQDIHAILAKDPHNTDEIHSLTIISHVFSVYQNWLSCM